MVDDGDAGPPDRVPRPAPIDLSYDELADGELLGQGGNADVYLAEVWRDGERIPVAVKQPRFQGTLHGDVVDRFRTEAEVWSGIDDHDHVVGLLDWGLEPLPWLAMEYMDGGSLEDRHAEGLLPLDQAAWVALGIARAVRHAHRHGVAHLDLKPANVLFRSTGAWPVPKVSDWGLARLMLDDPSSVEGLSPQYAAPEQFEPAAYGSPDDRTDVYQLGVIAYELFVGGPPFEGPAPSVMRSVLNESPPPPSTVADVPESVDDAVMPALAREPDDRYEDVLYLRDELAALWEQLRESPDSDPAEATSTAPLEPDTAGEPGTDVDEQSPRETSPDGEVSSDSGTPLDGGADTGRAPTSDGEDASRQEAATGTGGADGRSGAADGADTAPGDASEGAGRRDLLKVAGAVAGLGALGAGGLALAPGRGENAPPDDDGGDSVGGATTEPAGRAASGTVRVGVLQPLGERFGTYGRTGIRGFLSGLAYRAGRTPPADVGVGTRTVAVGDVDYELHVRDTQLDGSRARELATELVGEADVDLLFGCTSLAGATSVARRVAVEEGVPYVAGPVTAPSLTADDESCDPLVFRANGTAAMSGYAGGRTVAKSPGVDSVALFATDFDNGRALLDNYRRGIEGSGVTVVHRELVPRGADDWQARLQEAADAGADGVVGGFTGSTMAGLLRTFLSGEYGLRVFGSFAARQTLATIGSVFQDAFGGSFAAEDLKRAGIEPFATLYHWNQYENPINDRFVADHVEAYGVLPDLLSAGTFTAASAVDQAVTESGSTDPAAIADAMRGMTVEATPKGPGGYTFQSYNNQARSRVTAAYPIPTRDEWADSWDQPVMPGVPELRYDEATLTADDEQVTCSL